MRPLFALIVLAACGRPIDEEAEPARAVTLTLTLETRDGIGSQGYSFASGQLVPASEADLRISSSDCGARGRWVTLNAGEGLLLCHAQVCSPTLAAGGTDEAFHEPFEVRRGDSVLGTARITRETPTPGDWYVPSPTPPFEVLLALTPAAR